MRLIRWAIVLVVLAGLGWAAVAVPFGGRTLLDRVLDRSTKDPPVGKSTADAVADPAVPAGPTKPANPPEPAPAGASDVHTEEDRAQLNKLIEDKLEREGKDAAAEPSAPTAGRPAADSK